METPKRGRPRKSQSIEFKSGVGLALAGGARTTIGASMVDELASEPVLLSIGIERVDEGEGRRYSAFLMKTKGNIVVDKISKQVDFKQSSIDTLQSMYLDLLQMYFEGNF